MALGGGQDGPVVVSGERGRACRVVHQHPLPAGKHHPDVAISGHFHIPKQQGLPLLSKVHARGLSVGGHHVKALGRPRRGEPQVAVGVKIHPAHGRARRPTHFGQFNARVGGVQHPDHLAVSQFQQAFLVGGEHHMGGVRGVDAHIHDVLDIGDVVGASRKGWDVPCSVAELVEAVGSELGRPRGTDPVRGDPKVVVPAVHPAHRRIGRTQGAVGAGGDAQCRRLGGPCHDPAHGACQPHAAWTSSRPHGQILNIHKRRERIVDGHRFALGVPSPGLTAGSHEQAFLSGAIRGQDPRPFRHAAPWQPRPHPNRPSLPKGRHPCRAKAQRCRSRGLRWPSTTCLRSASTPARPRGQVPATKVPNGRDWRGRDRIGRRSRHRGPSPQAIGLRTPSRSGHPQERRQV